MDSDNTVNDSLADWKTYLCDIHKEKFEME